MRTALPFALIAGVIAGHSLRLGCALPFTPALPAPAARALELRDCRLQMPKASGRVRVHAAEVRPGHERLGPFRLGIPTHLELHFVTAEAAGDAGASTFHCRRGRLTTEGLRLEGPVLCREPGGTSLAGEVTVSPGGTVRIGDRRR